MVRFVIIYDEDCPYCQTSVSVARRLIDDDTMIVPWENEDVQKLLTEKFEEPPFTLLFVDLEAERLYAGEDAMKYMNSNSLGINSANRIFNDNYSTISGLVGMLTGRSRSADMNSGEFDLTEVETELAREIAS